MKESEKESDEKNEPRTVDKCNEYAKSFLSKASVRILFEKNVDNSFHRDDMYMDFVWAIWPANDISTADATATCHTRSI